MPIDRFMIAPLNTGLQTDLKPWLIPDDAFFRLQNAYIFRGRVRKRFGAILMNGSVDPSVAQLYSRFRILVGTTDGSGNLSGTVPGVIFQIGQLFSIGDEIFTVYQTGTPVAMLKTGSTTTATYDTTTGAFNFVGAAALTDVFFYPAQPVMGLLTYETAAINDEPVFGFDTQFAYTYNGTSWQRSSAEASAGASVWTGSNADFFWGYTYRGVSDSNNYFFVSNFVAIDLMRFFDGTQWNFFNPVYNNGSETIETARIIVPFKNRLVLLNTIETVSAANTAFVNRCRFSVNGDPTSVNAWNEDIPGQGGYVDLPTKEVIVTAQFLKDRLIVYCESSTWELVYTGNQVLPFVWQQINTELGAESTFSEVPFDKLILGVGNVGIHACNGANVERIDSKIPDSVFEVSNDNEGVFRVYGIRDYFAEMVYWTFPSLELDSTFPNRVLIYNYRTQSWAFNDDSITAFGYYQQQDSITWASTNDTWQDSVEAWNNAILQAKFRQIIAGNQEGFVFIVDTEGTRNAPALQITNLIVTGNVVTITAINHNLLPGDYIYIENTVGVNLPILGFYPVASVIDVNNFTLENTDITLALGGYLGGGTITRVSRIDIWTKQYNFYVNQGRNVAINKVDFLVDKTALGAITIDFFPSSTELSMIQEGQATGAIIGTNVLETSAYPLVPLESQQDRVWHPVYLQADGECIQLRIYLSDDQMVNIDTAFSDFQLNAMTFYAQPTSQRLQ